MDQKDNRNISISRACIVVYSNHMGAARGKYYIIVSVIMYYNLLYKYYININNIL